jgi:type II secretory pathway predicted ATPase ExeA
MLEEIRFFTNFQMDAVSPLTLILAGQTDLPARLSECNAQAGSAQAGLKARLKLQSFEAITQRITLRHHLSGLSGLETKRYIEHHLKVAGAHRPLFSGDAIQLIYRFLKGIPRKINNLCTACLLDGFLEKKSVIDVATVRKALQEFEDD